MGVVVYGGDPLASKNSTEFRNYESGIKMGSLAFAESFIFMAIGSALLEKFNLFNKNLKILYTSAYVLLAISFLAIYFHPSDYSIFGTFWLKET
jgi:hypothetical protein